MQKFMEQFGEFWKVWGPWISISLIPTIIAGLSISPKTAPEAAFVSKAWGMIKQFLSFFSLATFKDDAGTFQAPKVLSVPFRMVFKKTPPPTALILFFVMGATTLSGCCAWTGTCGKDDVGGQVATGAINCGKAAIIKEIANLLPTVLAVLTGGAANWDTQLNALGGVGADALACAIQQATGQLLTKSTPPASAPAAGPEVMKERAVAAEGAQKGNEYMAKKKWKFAPAVEAKP